MNRTIFTAFLLAFFLPLCTLSAQISDTTGIHAFLDSLLIEYKSVSSNEAFEEAKKTLDSLENILLPAYSNSDQYASLCHLQAGIHIGVSKYQEGKEYLEKAQGIFQKNGHECDHYTFLIEHGLGSVAIRQGNLADAELHLNRAVECNENAHGENHKSIGQTTNALGVLYFHKRELDKAEYYFTKFGDLVRRNQGAESTDHARSLMNLGNVSVLNGNHDKAILNYQKSLEIYEKNEKTDDRNYALALANMSYLFGIQKEYKKEEEALLKSLDILKKNNKQEFEEYANVLMNLGNLNYSTGNFELALQRQKEALSVYEKTTGKTSDFYLGCMVNIGVIYDELEQFENAEAMFLEVIQTFEEHFDPPKHEYYMNALYNLGNVYFVLNQLDKAEKMYDKASSVFPKEELTDEMLLSRSNKEANLYMEKGNYVKADSVLTQSKNLGLEDSPSFSKLNDNPRLRIITKYRLNDFKAADTYFEEWSNRDRDLLSTSATFLSETEITNYLLTKSYALNNILSTIEENRSKLLKFNSILFNELILLKSYSLYSASSFKRRANAVTEHKVQYEEYLQTLRAVSELHSNSDADRHTIDSLQQVADGIEKDLTRKVGGVPQSSYYLTWENLQRKMTEKQGIIEFFHYTQTDEATGKQSTNYIALLLKKEFNEPLFIPLFGEQELLNLTTKYQYRRGGYANYLYGKNNEENGLYNLIWKPLEEYIEDLENIYISPSGILHQINMSAVINSNRPKENPVKLVRMNSTRELLADNTFFGPNNQAVLIGGVRYEMDSTVIQSAISLYRGHTTEKLLYSFEHIDSSSISGNEDWGFLPSSLQEVEGIVTILNNVSVETQLKTGFSATEESFKALDGNSPRILHISTHAYFFPDPVKSNLQRQSSFKSSEHPLIRSGLVLAGSNYAWKKGKPINSDTEDGILTAYEISQLDLSQTELVVLSACETGLGDIKGNEGVYGLQRAFKMAGAQHIIMSLWQVSDYHTKDLMERFYKNWLERGMDIQTALNTAQNSMKAQGLSPYYWAGFVVLQ